MVHVDDCCLICAEPLEWVGMGPCGECCINLRYLKTLTQALMPGVWGWCFGVAHASRSAWKAATLLPGPNSPSDAKYAGHKDACSKCWARWRFVLKDKNCMVCKQEQPAVFFTRFMGDYTNTMAPDQFGDLKASAARGSEAAATGVEDLGCDRMRPQVLLQKQQAATHPFDQPLPASQHPHPLLHLCTTGTCKQGGVLLPA